MKLIRKWSRILHRDFGFFFVGATIIYALSGIALNHIQDWNPNYVVEIEDFNTTIQLSKTLGVEENILELLDDIDDRANYKKHYYPQSDYIKIFLRGGSSVIVNTETGEGSAEFLRKRQVFYQVNYLHYNPSEWWMWFSDIFAGALILLAITGLFILKGKNGISGRGGWLTVAGIIIPILFLLFL
ncbi:MAG: hypothetical protein B6I20_02370 [Bacteroidetes bacterium 4572_117]|nr:MAG: hypothetical protein B6I20_02370 [Bacteroidetes bacterium 4572_117]